MKKTLALTLIMALLFSATAGTQLVRVGKADAWEYTGEESADAYTNPPTVLIQFPENNKTYSENSVSLTFNVRVGESTTAKYTIITEVYYEGDWQQSNTIIHEVDLESSDRYFYGFASRDFALNFTGIPEGNHNITIHATEYGNYYRALYRSSSFTINGSSSVSFTIDTVPPRIFVLSPITEGLKFTVNEPTSWIGYSIDGGANATVTGNTTLTGLPYGSHTLTVYANDTAGNMGKSDSISFTIAEPFPMSYSVGFVAVIVFVLLGATVYILKRKR